MKISMIPNKIVKLIHASKGDTSLRKWAFEPYDNNGAINVSNIKPQLVYKTENGGTEQLLPVNTSTPTTSYFDGTINYGTDTDVEFTYKQSSYTGQARIKSIKGNTLVWNQLCDVANPNSQGSPYTYNSSNHSYTVTWEEGSTSTAYVRWTNIPIVAGHKYLVRAKVISATTGWQIRCLPPTSSTGTNLYPGTHADLFGKGEIFVGSADSQGTFSISKNSTFTTAQTVTFIPQIFDLSAKFGVGNEPTADVFNALYSLNYYAYNSGSLLNFNGTGIKTTGKNLLEVKAVNRIADGVTFTVNSDGSIKMQGTSTGGSSYIVLDNATNSLAIGDPLIRKGTSIKCYTGDSVRLAYRMGSNYGNIANGGTLTATDDIYHFYIQVANGVTIDKTVYPMVTFADVTDSTFEPYTSSTLSLPISTYFPTGMKSAGSVYDELSDKAITRVGSYTITSFDAKGGSIAVNTYRIVSLRSLIKKPSANTVMANIVSDKFPTAIYNEVYSGRQSGISVNSTGDVFVDLSYSTLEDANTWVATNPITLNYELATYTETDIQNASLVCKNIEVPCYLSNGNLVCDATEELTNESGFFDAKLKLKDSSGVAYSSKFKLHVEDL